MTDFQSLQVLNASEVAAVPLKTDMRVSRSVSSDRTGYPNRNQACIRSFADLSSTRSCKGLNEFVEALLGILPPV
ncbi:hypothetical protein EYZ11_011518 [Aspergillus tanneri]|uniref:Uncharacterized protein n=1 Tax=Aspergillus tanneri TaxID=1220188 RepID=A0A4S3J2K5_9EURO|nr:hypothetical protein EYZ11_011518 [Aspergillus tanneri]